MSFPTDRILLFDRGMNVLRELSPSEVFGRVRSEEINGEHELVVTTTRKLEEGWRLLTVDASGEWREFVVTEPDEEHSSGMNAIGTYRCVWSLQYDLTASYAHVDAVSVGLGSSMTSAEAAELVLEGVANWSVGTCDAADIADGDGVVFIYESSWSKLSKLVEATGWEVDASIEVSNLYGVVSRKLMLRSHIGKTEATRRFDWGQDVSSIRRTPDPGPYYCRIVPLGKGESEYADDDETTFEWPLDITDETGDPNLYYIEDPEAAAAFRMPDGRGGWWYPTKTVSYDEDDPELLLMAAQADLPNHTRPGVTYEASVAQYEKAGLDTKGVALGDEIQVVDRGFNPDAALRLQARVVKVEVDELSPSVGTTLTIGSIRDTMTVTLAKLSDQTTRIADTVANLSTARYLHELLDRINDEINATGGYSYIVDGEGFITYDIAVTDTLRGYNEQTGQYASQVVQIKGGSIRIANSNKDGISSRSGLGDWDWKTVFVSGHIAAEVVTAAMIRSGWIGSADAAGNYSGSGNYINFDTGELHLSTQYSSRNLIRNGNFITSTSYWEGVGTTVTEEADNQFSHCLKVVQSGTGSSSRCVRPNTSTNFTHNSSVTYTLTFWAKTNSDNTLTVNRAGYASNQYLDGVATTSTWTQYTATLESGGTGALCFYLGTSGTLYLAEVMLVTGNSSIGFSENASDLDQEGVLYRLTGGYANEGLYIDNGHLYINASYIHGGTLVAGGANNVNGVIEVRNASGATVCKFDKNGADINGKITSTSGEIGGFTITTNSLYNNRSSLTGGTQGVYISTTGISTGNGTAWIAMGSGNIYGGGGSSQYGYLSFNHSFSGTSSGYGPRLAGTGGIALLCGSLVVGSYTGMSSSGTGKVGITSTYYDVVSGLQASWERHTIVLSDGQSVTGLCRNLSISWNRMDMVFTKGLLT